VALTVLNYDAWCSVSVDGQTATTAASQIVNVAPGTIPLTEAPKSGAFQLGDWYGVTGDTGTGTPGSADGGISVASVVVGSSPVCVSVCCPFTGGSGCPGTNQCPDAG
jgi:hypothetical protein